MDAEEYDDWHDVEPDPGGLDVEDHWLSKNRADFPAERTGHIPSSSAKV